MGRSEVVPEVLYRKLILPELRGTYDDLFAVAAGADLMIDGNWSSRGEAPVALFLPRSFSAGQSAEPHLLA